MLRMEVSIVPTDPSGRTMPIPASQVEFLVATAARAPSVQNTQPWRFRVRQPWMEVHADRGRKLRADPAGREMLISCGAAVFGLRLGMRSLGFVPVVDLLPDRSRPGLVARARLGAAEPMTRAERQMFEALPHRHTHRGQFAGGPLPDGLLGDMERDAVAEGAMLGLVEGGSSYERLAEIVQKVTSERDAAAQVRAEMREWTRAPGAVDRDGVPASAFPADQDPHRRRLRQRDFDLDRGLGRLDVGGPAPPVTAVLVTPGDAEGDWLCAGQALHRLLARGAARWVFASLYSQPLERPEVRELIAVGLRLAGHPQMILQLGPARSTHVTARRPPPDLIDS
jgi:nitroreductase